MKITNFIQLIFLFSSFHILLLAKPEQDEILLALKCFDEFDQRIFNGELLLILKSREIIGDHVLAGFLGTQFEFMSKRYILVNTNLGQATKALDDLLDYDEYVWGIGLTIGADTPFGPISATVMGGRRHNALTFINIGYRF